MQTFKDSITNEIWQFEDNVLDIHAFPNTPDTLQPYVIPAPTAAQLLSAAQAAQLAAIESAYQAAIQQPIAYMGTSFQADTASQNLMAQTIIGLQAIVAIGGAVPSDFGWWAANNVKVPMTLVQLQGLYATGVLAVDSAFARKQAKKAAVRAATTPAAVITINF
jgi:hypothetical protein